MHRKTASLLAFFFFTLLPILPGESSLEISGPGIAPIKLSAQDLSRMPRLKLDVLPHKGEMQHYEGVRVSDLLAKAGVTLGEKLRGRGLATYVVAKASDGYAVVYSIAELDPAMTDNQVIVADTMNGKPLEPKEGPFKIVVPGDKRPARWIRMLTALQIENVVNPSESSPR
jgi:DMSO/TMAO reductase YedYZ molybdopterin-dependent catalytic subunit